jgi:hypothetical protein
MKENIERCKSGPEYILTIFQDGLPQTVISLIERFEHWEIELSPSGIRQGFYKLIKRHPDLFETAKNDENKTIYTMIPAACQLPHEEILKLWRKHITWHVLLGQQPALKEALTSKVLDSNEAAQVSLSDVLTSLEKWQETVANLNTRLSRLEQVKDEFVKGAVDPEYRGSFDINININFGRKEG